MEPDIAPLLKRGKAGPPGIKRYAHCLVSGCFLGRPVLQSCSRSNHHGCPILLHCRGHDPPKTCRRGTARASRIAHHPPQVKFVSVVVSTPFVSTVRANWRRSAELCRKPTFHALWAIGMGAPWSATNLWGSQQAFPNRARSACIWRSASNDLSVASSIEAALESAGGSIR
jgi:hypothetical protein